MYFVLLTVALLVGLALTLPRVPYRPINAATPDARVAVTGLDVDLAIRHDHR